MPELEIHYEDEWAALYVDGKLDPDSVGDSYVAEERAFSMLGVKQVQDDAFMRGQDQRSGVARTLAEVEEYRQDRERRQAEAELLRVEAQALFARAVELEGK